MVQTDISTVPPRIILAQFSIISLEDIHFTGLFIQLLLPAELVEFFFSTDELYGAVVQENSSTLWIVDIEHKQLRSTAPFYFIFLKPMSQLHHRLKAALIS